LRAHVNGDPHAFAQLVARHQDRLWAIALRVMRNPEDAADALLNPDQRAALVLVDMYGYLSRRPR
jgi:DNA-directed RNA polymerase specialized sigma24 family protein